MLGALLVACSAQPVPDLESSQPAKRGSKQNQTPPKDPSLDPLRSREDFRQLLAEWEATRKP